jgi:arabinose-5-phosphate isomerase
MAEALLVISAKGFGVTGVTDEDGRLEGVITDGDLRRHMEGLLSRRAGEVMTENPLTIAPDALAEEAVARMQERRVTCLFVQGEGGRPSGLIHVHDCLRAGLG